MVLNPSSFNSPDFNVKIIFENDSKVVFDVDFQGKTTKVALNLLNSNKEDVDSNRINSDNVIVLNIFSKKSPEELTQDEKLALCVDELIKNNPENRKLFGDRVKGSLLESVKFSLFENAVHNPKAYETRNVWRNLSYPLSAEAESLLKQVFNYRFESNARDQAAIFMAQMGRFDALKLIMGTGPVSTNALSTILFEAVNRNDLNILQHVSLLDVDLHTSICQAARIAVLQSKLEVFEILINSKKINEVFFDYLLSLCIEKNNMQLLGFLIDSDRLTTNNLGEAILCVTKSGKVDALKLLFDKGLFNRSEAFQNEAFQNKAFEKKIEESIYIAASQENSIVLGVLLSRVPRPNTYLQKALTLSINTQRPNITNFLILSAPDQFWFNAGLIRGVVICMLAAESDVSNLELFLQRCGSITTDLRDDAIENARGPNWGLIVDMLRLMTINTELSSSPSSEPEATHTLEVSNWEDVKQDPLKYMELALKIDFHRVKFGDGKAIDLGGVSKQFITILFESLIKKKLLNLDYVHRLPLLTRPVNPEEEKALVLVSKFLSLIDKKNKDRSDKFLIGAIFDPLFFGFLKSNPPFTFQSYLEIKNLNVRSDILALLKDPNDEKALLGMGGALKEIDERLQSVDDWRYGVEKAAEIIRSHLSDSLKQKIDLLQISSDFQRFSINLQGVEATSEHILKNLSVQDGAMNAYHIHLYSNFHYLQRVEWLKEWIGKLEFQELANFVNCVTGRQVIDDMTKISVRPSRIGGIEAHSCFNAIDIPSTNIEITKEVFESLMNTFIAQMNYNAR